MNQFEFKRGALGLGLISTAVALVACSTLQHSSVPILKAALIAVEPVAVKLRFDTHNFHY